MAIGPDSQINISAKAVIWGACVIGAALLGAAWFISTFVMSAVQDDVRTIREDVAAVRSATDDKVTTLVSSDGDLDKSIAELTAQIAINNERLQSLNGKLEQIEISLAETISRQMDFERYVVTRLSSPTALPGKWVAEQNAIVSEISSSETDPLADWYNNLIEIQAIEE